MATGAGNLMAFETTLALREIKYTVLEGTSDPAVRISYTLDNIAHLDVCFWFDGNGEAVHFATSAIAHVPKDRIDVSLRAINDANARYRWLRFYLDDDSDIVCSGDQLLVPDVVGECCHQLLSCTITICDEVCTTFMRALWAS